MDATPIVMKYYLASGSKTCVVLTLLEVNYKWASDSEKWQILYCIWTYIGKGLLINEEKHEYFFILYLGPPFLMI
jgi:hypothetical protein